MDEESVKPRFDQDLESLIAVTGYDVYQQNEETGRMIEEILKPEEVIVPEEDKPTLLVFPPIPEDEKDHRYDTLKTDVHVSLAMQEIAGNINAWIEKFPEGTKRRTSDVLFLQNGRYDPEQRDFNGYAMSVVLVTTPLAIPTKAFHPDRMFYGMVAIPIPYPDVCENASKKFYEATDEEIKVAIDSINFEPERNTDFIGVFQEHHFIGSHFRLRRWAIVQLGDEEQSATLYEMMTSSKYREKSFYTLYKDGAIGYKQFQRKVKEKRIDVIDQLLSKFELSYDMLKKSEAMIISQEEHSLYTLFDHSIFCVARGAFYCEAKPFMIWKGHTQGFTFFEKGPSMEVHSKFLHAIPYDTGLIEVSSSNAYVPDTIYGDTDVIAETTMRNMDTEFVESLGRIGVNPAAPTTNVIPLCVKIFNAKELY